MKSTTTIVIATRNMGKTAEIRDLLDGYPVNIKNLDDFGPIPPVVEDGDTFDDNAYKKSSFTARVLGLPALADDSGLMVSALDGAPGVYSARYGGEDATDEERCRKLLKALGNRQDREAAFECVISLAVPTGPALTFEGRCDGLITMKPSGSNGFGYDPVFFYPEFNKTFAELTIKEKSTISHRGKALREFCNEFDNVLKWLDRHMPEPDKIGCQSLKTKE